jgi:hypothetical protein
MREPDFEKEQKPQPSQSTGRANTKSNARAKSVMGQFEFALKGHSFTVCGNTRSCSCVAQRFSAAVSVLL